MSTAPPLEGALEAGDLPGPRQRPGGPSRTVQEGGETCRRGLLGARSETKAESAEADRGRRGCFLRFRLGGPKRRSSVCGAPEGPRGFGVRWPRGPLASGRTGSLVGAPSVCQAAPWLQVTRSLPVQKSTDYHHPPGNLLWLRGKSRPEISHRERQRGAAWAWKVGCRGLRSRRSCSLVTCLQSRRGTWHLTPPSRPQLGVTRGSAPPGYPAVLVWPRIAGSCVWETGGRLTFGAGVAVPPCLWGDAHQARGGGRESWQQLGAERQGPHPLGTWGHSSGCPVCGGQRGSSAGSRAGAQSLYDWAGAATAEHRRPGHGVRSVLSGGLCPGPADTVFSACPHVLAPRGVCVLISSSSKDTSHTVTGPP